MEYVYAAMLLHAAEQDIDEKAVGAVLKAAGVDVSEAMTQAVAAPAAAAAPAAGGAAAAAEEAPAAEEEEEEEEAGGFDGLGSLFG